MTGYGFSVLNSGACSVVGALSGVIYGIGVYRRYVKEIYHEEEMRKRHLNEIILYSKVFNS
jgi:hypothetical protein